MVNKKHAMLLVPVRKTGDSDPYIQPRTGDPTVFIPGCAVYCTPDSPVYISDGVEWFFVH
jgi:hypothetical protein